MKKILFHSKYFAGLLGYHERCPNEQIPTGFVSVAICGGFWEISANLTGLYCLIQHTDNSVDYTSVGLNAVP